MSTASQASLPDALAANRHEAPRTLRNCAEKGQRDSSASQEDSRIFPFFRWPQNLSERGREARAVSPFPKYLRVQIIGCLLKTFGPEKLQTRNMLRRQRDSNVKETSLSGENPSGVGFFYRIAAFRQLSVFRAALQKFRVPRDGRHRNSVSEARKAPCCTGSGLRRRR